jgi:hypothetical protein
MVRDRAVFLTKIRLSLYLPDLSCDSVQLREESALVIRKARLVHLFMITVFSYVISWNVQDIQSRCEVQWPR